ncbi:YcfA [Mannheimia sp. USDA-ARS-USMARC-1261]|uniref:type II toxin-antitoxin system HicA family toxin n=1 Tax=Mannheimia sp. USDA-ARS-USMARC-1261 TaxID=1432056 RepID=UPI0003E3241A|nr:type II toxin-antitoxin system HicA family toxin [Mannheimia sp. USDA-ARS-USMARC-1261]AHG73194.1 YcfA [Mannheimia sp. USDA-ARS-USMARC-1261]
MDSRSLVKLIVADGWFLVGIKGSHHQYKHSTKKGRVTFPHPKKDLPTATVKSILKQAGLE